MRALGRHILSEYYGCDPFVLDDVEFLKEIMEEAARRSGATIVNSVFHRFNPYGVSGVVVIAESHLSIHTWPEFGYASVDLYTCGEKVDPWIAFEFLKKKLKAKTATTIELKRGQLETVTLFKPQNYNLPFKAVGID